MLGMARGAQVCQMVQSQDLWLQETCPGPYFLTHLVLAWRATGVSQCLGRWEGWVDISSCVGLLLNLGREVCALICVEETLICSISSEDSVCVCVCVVKESLGENHAHIHVASLLDLDFGKMHQLSSLAGMPRLLSYLRR